MFINLSLNKKLLDHYLLTNSSDLQILPSYTNDINNSNNQSQQGFLSPSQSTMVPQQQNVSTPNNNSPNTSICSTTSPTHCSSFAMKQQAKLAGSPTFRYYYSSII